MATELAVIETGTRRFIERWVPFSISVNTAVLLQPFAAMELGRSDRESGRLVTPCGCPCGDLWPCLEKVDKQAARKPFRPVWGDLAKTASNHVGGEYSVAQNGWETGGGWQGRNVCRLKGG